VVQAQREVEAHLRESVGRLKTREANARISLGTLACSSR
jgi:hypothetical protein